MKTWYTQQDFYTEERYNAIVAWTEQDVIDIWNYNPVPLKTA